jgi:hypothetical protein
MTGSVGDLLRVISAACFVIAALIVGDWTAWALGGVAAFVLVGVTVPAMTKRTAPPTS